MYVCISLHNHYHCIRELGWRVSLPVRLIGPCFNWSSSWHVNFVNIAKSVSLNPLASL